ncbi:MULTISPECIES: Asp/Glu racemase [unclassified Pusillimonas]|uniref:maleate cis-trans isomerase family protein n=1 Tax=unclassified Pusillimonas TaxID=2640016 RepID=UPI000B9D4EF3|nr:MULTISPECIES: Asp/Glu racemase [unclassified Pusillimonas]OXR48808.1 Asp/Glu racemase [Pusillimonas sp. T2]ROT44100.1 Asp/Glu racemase [Pusillimonas sp. NJUB218]
MSRIYRIGQIVPSSNTTMETEIPLMLLSRAAQFPEERFTFHSSRMRMKKVTKDELAAMDKDSDRCALELSDAQVDVLGYACLVAIMSMGKGYHRESEKRLHQVTVDNGNPAPVISSAGALVEGLHTMGAKKVSILTPYMKPLTQLVVDYIESEGIEVLDAVSLEIPDNLEVGRQNPLAPAEHIKRVNTANADAVVLSACVQMPSFQSVQQVENSLGLPVTTAAISTVYQMLKALGLDRKVENAGSLLSGRF